MRLAKKELAKRIAEKAQNEQATHKKARRDAAIKDETVIRTYRYKDGIVKDHRSGKTAPLKKVLNGQIELLR